MFKRSIYDLFRFDGDELSVLASLPAEAGDEPPASPDDPLSAGDVGTPSPEAASPAWTGPSRDEWEATQEQLAYYANLLEQAVAPPEQYEQQYAAEPEPQFELDPFSDDFGQGLAQLIDQRLQSVADQIGQRLDQRLQPVTTQFESQRIEEAEARAKDILSDLAASEGDFDQAAARQYAEVLLPQMRERYGPGPRAAEMALREAGRHLRSIESAAEQRGAEKYRNQLGAVAGATREPGAAGAAVHTIPDAADEIELVNRLIGLPGR